MAERKVAVMRRSQQQAHVPAAESARRVPSMRQGVRTAAPVQRRSVDKLVAAAKAHRRTMDRMLDRQIMLPVKDVYQGTGDSLGRALRRGFRGQLKAPAGARATYQQLTAVVDAKMRGVADKLVAEMEHATIGTLSESAHALAAFMGRMQGGSVLDDEVVLSRVMNAQRQALEAARAESAARLSAGIYDALRKRLDREVSDGATLGQAIAGLGEELDMQWWQVERMVRTETSYAFNRAHEAGIAALGAAEPGVRMRWTEHVDDLTGAPTDNRVGKDSLVLHGQVAAPGKMFHMPPDPRTPKGMEGKDWAHPPNRPNDRAVLLPWRSGWGIPAWEWRNGKRVPLKS